MPEESIWGKNAVDATRKNSLPQYIDDTIGEVKGQYVKKSGDTMMGPLIQRSGIIDINITPSSNQWDAQYQLKDKNGEEIGAIYAIRTNNDLLGIQMEVSRVNLAGKRINNNIRLYLNNDGVQSVEVANAAAWQTALNILPRSGGTLTGNVTIGSTSTTSERDLYVISNSGGIVLYSTGTSTGNGNRGLWMQAHGTGGAGNIIAVDTNNNITYTGGTFSSGLTINGASIIEGTLNVDSSVIDRTVTPSDNQYHGVFFRDKNNRRLANLEYTKLPDDNARLNLFVLRPGTTEDSYAGMMIIRRKNDGKTYVNVPNDNVDGVILRNIQCLGSNNAGVETAYIKMIRK